MLNWEARPTGVESAVSEEAARCWITGGKHQIWKGREARVVDWWSDEWWSATGSGRSPPFLLSVMVVVVVSLDEGGVGRNGRVGGCIGRSAAKSSAGGTTPARKHRTRPGFRAGTDARCCCAHSSRRQPGNADGVGSACGMRRSRRRLRSGAPIADARGSSGSDL
ncbi:putative kanadaptin [Iris pallida]|uniref:Kanadaptin n=1 Tax=Iris pallida TaxID=29817 RepID=A0AAX6ESE7_IRIPA|nr:putative kanadaptin [Iris pallida]